MSDGVDIWAFRAGLTMGSLLAIQGKSTLLLHCHPDRVAEHISEIHRMIGDVINQFYEDRLAISPIRITDEAK